jgi:4-hydroxy-tetrahydrodipicolinate synthase
LKPLKANEIRGNWATLLSVWNADDSLDLSRMAEEIDRIIGMKVDGIYSNGTAGEFHAQTEDEFDSISEMLAMKCARAGMPFQIGVSHMSAQISRERLKRIKHLEPSAVQLILPDWFPVTDKEAISFLATMDELSGNIGLVLYNPPHAKRILKPHEVRVLSERIPGIVGLKTAAGDTDWYREMQKYIPELSVFVPGHLLASGISMGASGAYSNVACLNPLAAQRWSDSMKTDLPTALELEARIRSFMDTYISPFITKFKYSNAACDRLLALIGNWADVGTTMRWPYQSIPATEADKLRPVALKAIPEFFETG